MSTATQTQATEVLFLRVSPELKERIKDAAKNRELQKGEVRRRGYINRMIVDLLESTYMEVSDNDGS